MAFDREVEDRTPHHRGAEAAKGEEDHADGHFHHAEAGSGEHGHRALHVRRGEDAHEHEDQRQRGDERKLSLARNLTAQQAAQQTAAHHQEPVGTHQRAGSGRRHAHTARRSIGGRRQEQIHEVGNTDLDTYVNEDGDRTQQEVAERKGAVLVLDLGFLLLDGRTAREC